MNYRVLFAKRGFTIVELLIVIVVIAILAAITIVAYNGTQQRANNTAIIDAASKSLRMIQAYVAVNGAYPLTSNGDACVTAISGCLSDTGTTINASATFNSKIATVGSVPQEIPSPGTLAYGIWVTYNTSQTLNGVTQPLRLTYMLSGTAQACGLSGVVQYSWPNFVPATMGYTNGNTSSTGKTLCWISVPGPSS